MFGVNNEQKRKAAYQFWIRHCPDIEEGESCDGPTAMASLSVPVKWEQCFKPEWRGGHNERQRCRFQKGWTEALRSGLRHAVPGHCEFKFKDHYINDNGIASGTGQCCFPDCRKVMFSCDTESTDTDDCLVFELTFKGKYLNIRFLR